MPPPRRTEATDAAVLAAIRARIDPHPDGQIPLGVLAGDLDVSVDTVRRAQRRLEAAGRLQVRDESTPWGGGAPRRYRPMPVTSGTDGEDNDKPLSSQSFPPAQTSIAGQPVRSRSVDARVAPVVDA